MAQSTDLSYRRVAWCTTWHLREDTLKAAVTALVNDHHHLPLSQAWGSGMLASSDGQRFPGDVSQVLIPSQRACPNSYRLMKSPMTRSCMRSVLEKHSVRRTSRLIRVRKLMCLLSIFWVFSLPT
jgi:hypothetical protein